MTTGKLSVFEKTKDQKDKQVVSDAVSVPLLPYKHDDGTEEGLPAASFSGAVFNLSTTIIGAGIMALPATMKVLGLVPGTLMLVLVPLLTDASIEMLLRFNRAGKAASYGGVMGDAFGKAGRILLQLCVVVNNAGILIVYMIIIGDVLSGTSSSGIHHSGILEEWFGQHWWSGRTFVLFATTLCVFSPLVCLKRIDSLRHSSALSIALAVFFVVITAGIAITKLANKSIAMPKLFPDIRDLASFWKLFTVFPVLITAFICHFNVHAINSEIEDTTQMQPIVRVSLALCSSVYIVTSFFNYLLFGDFTLDDVLANYDSNLGIPFSSLLNDAVRLSYAVHLMLVFPIVFFPLRLNVDGLLFPSSRPLISDNKRFSLITVILVSLLFLGANCIPSIWDAFQFTGATATVCIGFIFPAAITLRDPHGIATQWDKILSVFMIVLAVLSNGLAISSNVNSFFYKGKVSPH